MPNVPQQVTIVQYIANNAQTQYTFDFYAPLNTDIQVYYQSSTVTPVPAADILVLNVNYTVTFNADPTTGGYITLLFTPTTGFYLTINRQVQASLNTTFSEAQNFNGANLDAALDRLLLLCQQNLNYILQRNLSYIINSYLPNATPFLPNSNANLQLPLLPQNYFWVGSGTGIIAAQIAQIPSASVLQSMLANNSPGTDGARLVGYYDVVDTFPTTVTAFLNNLPTYLALYLLSYNGDYSADTGSANVYVGTPSPAYTTYVIGKIFKLKVANTNTISTCTLDISSLGTTPITLTNGAGLLPGDLVRGMIALFVFDGTNMQLINPIIGLKYPALAASAFCSAAHPWNQTTALLVAYDSVEFDPYTMFNAGSNGFIVPFAGKYRISASLAYNLVGGSGANSAIMYLLKNGTVIKRLSTAGTVSATNCFDGSVIVNAAISDSFTIDILKTDSASASYAIDGLGGTPQQCSSFTIEYLGT